MADAVGGELRLLEAGWVRPTYELCGQGACFARLQTERAFRDAAAGATADGRWRLSPARWRRRVEVTEPATGRAVAVWDRRGWGSRGVLRLGHRSLDWRRAGGWAWSAWSLEEGGVELVRARLRGWRQRVHVSVAGAAADDGDLSLLVLTAAYVALVLAREQEASVGAGGATAPVG
jgi:hypothetical protein